MSRIRVKILARAFHLKNSLLSRYFIALFQVSTLIFCRSKKTPLALARTKKKTQRALCSPDQLIGAEPTSGITKLTQPGATVLCCVALERVSFTRPITITRQRVSPVYIRFAPFPRFFLLARSLSHSISLQRAF